MMANQDWLSSRDFSIQASEKFWQTQTQRLDWIKPWKTLTTGTLATGDVKWFEEGELNVCYNCVDRHLKDNGNKTAIYLYSDL